MLDLNVRLYCIEQLSDGSGNNHRYLDGINGSNVKLLLLKALLLFFSFFLSSKSVVAEWNIIMKGFLFLACKECSFLIMTFS